mmetsp:Transcript_50279/g.75086  ORF Transcript_50279/g.75086 Transcript_50279/m.75086 type:complete len:249 (-) Transcript_50279:90-836(-)|eukprot:CAMPEP_0194049658 /NCGR_PEP_ID=MMETSP0009_2-20130614/30818_1 /TAXON_ID=210454 /ORGANISM="Grammatophora oceanica, Strain CCMP 410" /LENGTH=248 /DNA_ID=CAMNT_0038695865 /DNA_START=96 /DNA_END=842 /DNA_ORIENTATION=-
MSKSLNYKQTLNVERRTWDKEAYEAKAKARAKAEAEGGRLEDDRKIPGGGKKDDAEGEKEEFQPAQAGAAGPEFSDRAFLKARGSRVNDIDAKAGTSEIVSTEAAAKTKTGSITDGVTKTGVGWHCKVCDCFLKDSHAYLDHINGRKHQRSLGYSMRVERTSKGKLLAKLGQLKKKHNTDAANDEPTTETNFAAKVKQKDEEERLKKEERKRRRKEKKQKAREQQTSHSGMDPSVAAAMGLPSGFGGS